MLCERPNAPRLATGTTDPEDVCVFCDGTGFRRWRGPHGWRCETCHICDGHSTAGVFVVQVLTARFQYELSYQSRSMVAARRRADLRALAVVRLGGLCMGYKVEAINVVYKSLDTQSKDEIVATVPLVAPAPVAA
jgi:heterodisulfide reductase subunit C